jgi:hypothetical protein
MRLGHVRAVLLAATIGVTCASGCSTTTPTTPTTPDAAVLHDGYPNVGDDGAEGCVLDGYPCPDAGSCCSGMCIGTICTERFDATPD